MIYTTLKLLFVKLIIALKKLYFKANNYCKQPIQFLKKFVAFKCARYSAKNCVLLRGGEGGGGNVFYVGDWLEF